MKNTTSLQLKIMLNKKIKKKNINLSKKRLINNKIVT